MKIMEAIIKDTTTGTTTPVKNDMILLTTKRFLYDNRRPFITGISVIAGFYLLIGMLLGMFHTGGGEGELSFYIFTAPIICSAFVSTLFSDMKSKEGRIALLMTPASAFAKIFPRFVIAFVMPWVILALGYSVMEGGRLLLNELMFDGSSSFYFDLGSMGSLLWLMISFFMMIMAAFFYGAILWPKLSFLKTTAVVQGVQLLIVVCIVWFINAIIRNGYAIEWLLSENATIWLFAAIGFLLMALFYILAYRRLKNSTVIYRLKQ